MNRCTICISHYLDLNMLRINNHFFQVDAIVIKSGLGFTTGYGILLFKFGIVMDLSDSPTTATGCGFGFPIALWMRTELAGFLERLFKQSRFVELGWFNQAAMDDLLAEHLSGAVDHNFRLWILMNLELWYRLYFEDMSVDDMQEFTASLQRG